MSQGKPADQHENGVVVPYDLIDPETLRNMIREFVSRDGSDWGDAGCTLDDKVAQVLRQLREKKARVVFDLNSATANIVVCS